jgi:HEPN domain-containing protein
MNSERFDKHTVMSYWRTEAEEALVVAQHLMETGDYSYALFFGHLAVEKLLKALYAWERDDHAPPTHNLQRLALACGLPLDEARTEMLLAITEFNLEARYPDLKRTFRVRCTRDYAQLQLARVEETMAWLRSRLM